MKKCTIVLGIVAAILAVYVGCKSIPSVDNMTITSTSIGVAAGYVANNTKIDDVSRNEVINIMNEVSMSIPEAKQTFVEAWMPIAKRHTQKLVDEFKINLIQADLIITSFSVAAKGLDYIFNVRYPKAGEYKDLVESAVHGFTGGFLTVFRPANMLSAPIHVARDEAAYEYLMKVNL